MRAHRSEVGQQVQGRWSLAAPIFAGGPEGPAGAPERRRTLAELLLERYGIVTREQVLAERVPGGFALLYDTFAKLETLGICRRGYFIEGMGGAQFALPGAVERLRAAGSGAAQTGASHDDGPRALVIAAADPAQPYGAALPWPKRDGQERAGRPSRVAGAYVVLVDDEPVLYVERGGRSLVTLAGGLVLAGSPSRLRLLAARPARPPARRPGRARRRGPRGPRGQARARAHRRPAGDRMGWLCADARRARFPAWSAPVYAVRLAGKYGQSDTFPGVDSAVTERFHSSVRIPLSVRRMDLLETVVEWSELSCY